MKIILRQYYNQAIEMYRSASLEEKIATSVFGILLLVTAGLMPAARIDAGDSALVNIYVDGERRSITTSADTVAEVLDRADIVLGEKDLVEPSLDAEITNQVFNINVYRAYPVTIIDGDDTYQVMSAYDSARLIVKNSGVVDIHDEDKAYLDLVVDFLREGFVGRKVMIERASLVKFKSGDEQVALRTHAETVAEMLEELSIDVSNNDIVEPSLDTAIESGMVVSMTKVGFEVVTVNEEVQPGFRVIYDNDRPIGYNGVETEGTPGIIGITYEVEYRNGEEVARREINRSTESEPQPKIYIVGNKQGTYTNAQAEWLYLLRFCESTNNYSINTGNGFYGAYQFMIPTWNSIASITGRTDLIGVRPDLASPVDQDYMIIQNTKISTGGLARQNPGCYQTHNLSQFPPE